MYRLILIYGFRVCVGISFQDVLYSGDDIFHDAGGDTFRDTACASPSGACSDGRYTGDSFRWELLNVKKDFDVTRSLLLLELF